MSQTNALEFHIQGSLFVSNYPLSHSQLHFAQDTVLSGFYNVVQK